MSTERLQTEAPQKTSASQSSAIPSLLPCVDPLFIESDVPDNVILLLSQSLSGEESIFVLFHVNTPYHFSSDSDSVEKSPIWIAMTGTRLLVLASSAPDEPRYLESFGQDITVKYQSKLGRDEIVIGDHVLVIWFWESQKAFIQRALLLFPLPEHEKYLHIGNRYLEREDCDLAIPLLKKSLQILPTTKGYLFLAQILSCTDTPDETIDILHAACQLTSAESLLQEINTLFPDNIVLYIYLAVVCEQNGWWDACLTIYLALLQKNPDFDLYFLKLGEIYHRQNLAEKAIEHYEKFIALRTESLKTNSEMFVSWELSEPKSFSADPDLTKAFFDVGNIYERELDDLEQAATHYLALIRYAPLYLDAYTRFWNACYTLLTRQETRGNFPAFDFPAFLQLFHLLSPETYAATIRSEEALRLFEMHGILPETPAAPPLTYRKITEKDHIAVVHPGEQEYLHVVKNWLTNFVLSEEDSQGIEQYCEQVGEFNYPNLHQTIKQLAEFLNIDAPRCFISRGKIGVSVRNKDHPFIFIGSEHLNNTNERHFLPGELRFVIASQIEHVKSGHLLITDTELWRSLGTASFDGFLLALQCLPAGSFLGRLTHRFATMGLKKVYNMTKNTGIQKILRVFNNQAAEKAAADDDDAGEKAPIQRNGKSKSKSAAESESLFKEQLVGFARHAVYTADRIGLLACHNIEDACGAIFKVADDAYHELKHLPETGILDVLQRRDSRGNYLYDEYAKRLSELMKFALSEEYQRLHAKLVIVADEEKQEEPKKKRMPHSPEYVALLNKLKILDQSRQSGLLTYDEFFQKQRKLINESGMLDEDGKGLLEKIQHAYHDHILNDDEFQRKILQLLEDYKE